MAVDLSGMTRQELLQLQKQIERQLLALDEDRRRAAVDEMKAVAARHNFDIGELVRMVDSKKTPSPARYRDPNDAGNTWAGRGRKPKWLVDALARGRSLDEFAIGH
jgi:DNA-binding protein H-NS